MKLITKKLIELENQIEKLEKAKKKYVKFDFKTTGAKMTAVEFYKRKAAIQAKLSFLKKQQKQLKLSIDASHDLFFGAKNVTI